MDDRAASPGPVLAVEGLAKVYDGRPVFQGVSLSVRAGEFVALTGESGVGKSTLLNCMAGLDTADQGRVLLLGQPVLSLDERAQAALRRQALGFVFQAFHVLPHLSVGDNVALPLLLRGGCSAADQTTRVARLLGAVGLEGLERRMPAQLSGGQLQRVAIARALVHRPALILADEPTGNLDPENAARILDLLHAQVREEGAACLLVTHSRSAAARADRRLRLCADGCLPDGPPP